MAGPVTLNALSEQDKQRLIRALDSKNVSSVTGALKNFVNNPKLIINTYKTDENFRKSWNTFFSNNDAIKEVTDGLSESGLKRFFLGPPENVRIIAALARYQEGYTLDPHFNSLIYLMNQNAEPHVVAYLMDRMLKYNGARGGINGSKMFNPLSQRNYSEEEKKEGVYTFKDFVYNYEKAIPPGFRGAFDRYFGTYPSSEERVEMLRSYIIPTSTGLGTSDELKFRDLVKEVFENGIRKSNLIPTPHFVESRPFSIGAKNDLIELFKRGADAEEVAEIIDFFKFDDIIEVYKKDNEFAQAWDSYFSARYGDKEDQKKITELQKKIYDEAKRVGYTLQPLENFGNFSTKEQIKRFEAALQEIKKKGGNVWEIGHKLIRTVQEAKEKQEELKEERCFELRYSLTWGSDWAAFIADLRHIFGWDFVKVMLTQAGSYLYAEPWKEGTKGPWYTIPVNLPFRYLKRWGVELPYWIIKDVILPVGAWQHWSKEWDATIAEPNPQNFLTAARAAQTFFIDTVLFAVPAHKLAEFVKAKRVGMNNLTRMAVEKAKEMSKAVGEGVKTLPQKIEAKVIESAEAARRASIRFAREYNEIMQTYGQKVRDRLLKEGAADDAALAMKVDSEVLKELALRRATHSLATSLSVTEKEARIAIEAMQLAGRRTATFSKKLTTFLADGMTADMAKKMAADLAAVLDKLPAESQDAVVKVYRALRKQNVKIRELGEQTAAKIKTAGEKLKELDLVTQRIAQLEKTQREAWKEINRLRKEVKELAEKVGIDELPIPELELIETPIEGQVVVALRNPRALQEILEAEKFLNGFKGGLPEAAGVGPKVSDAIDNILAQTKKALKDAEAIAGLRSHWYSRMWGRLIEFANPARSPIVRGAKAAKAKAGELLADTEAIRASKLLKPKVDELQKLEERLRSLEQAMAKAEREGAREEIRKLGMEQMKLEAEIIAKKVEISETPGFWTVLTAVAKKEGWKLPYTAPRALVQWLMPDIELYTTPSFLPYYLQRFLNEALEESEMAAVKKRADLAGIPTRTTAVKEGRPAPENTSGAGGTFQKAEEIETQKPKPVAQLTKQQEQWLQSNVLPTQVEDIKKILDANKLSVGELMLYEPDKIPVYLQKFFDWTQHPLLKEGDVDLIPFFVIDGYKLKPGSEMAFLNELLGKGVKSWSDFENNPSPYTAVFKKYGEKQ